jgi:hypothetical protein
VRPKGLGKFTNSPHRVSKDAAYLFQVFSRSFPTADCSRPPYRLEGQFQSDYTTSAIADVRILRDTNLYKKLVPSSNSSTYTILSSGM